MPFPTVPVTPGVGTTVNTLPNAGQSTMGESLPVALASDHTVLKVSDAPTNIATGQVVIGTAATVIAAARNGRRSIVVVNEGDVPVRLGSATVTMANGIVCWPLVPGADSSRIINSASDVYGIVASGTCQVSYLESF